MGNILSLKLFLFSYAVLVELILYQMLNIYWKYLKNTFQWQLLYNRYIS